MFACFVCFWFFVFAFVSFFSPVSLGERSGEAQKKRFIKTKLSTSPTPCCESLRQHHPNNSKHWQHAARDQSGTVFPGILSFRFTCKRIVFVKTPPFFVVFRSFLSFDFSPYQSHSLQSHCLLQLCCVALCYFAMFFGVWVAELFVFGCCLFCSLCVSSLLGFPFHFVS